MREDTIRKLMNNPHYQPSIEYGVPPIHENDIEKHQVAVVKRKRKSRKKLEPEEELWKKDK